MRENYREDATRILNALESFEAANGPIPGIVDPTRRDALVDQIIDSEQRVLYTERLQLRALDPSSADPSSAAFDPLKAALIHRDAGEYDEAVWLVYLFVHFGKHRRAGWRYVRDVYGRLGAGERWDWRNTSADPTYFRFWLHENLQALRAAPGPQGFGNHRKYESLNALEPTGTGAAVESYIQWVLAGGGDHRELFAQIDGLSPEEGFDLLYKSMVDVRRFGRIARFDYLTMLMKLRLLPIKPGHSYLVGSTGPLQGARLLLDVPGTMSTPNEAQVALARLAVGINQTADVMEDSVCNWQKSPGTYIRFSG